MCCSMACAEGLVKLFMFVANAIFALGGLALIVVGVLYKLNISDFTDAIPSDYQAIDLAPTLTIVIGSIIFVIAFFGCCGAIRESPCLLTTYSVILLIIFLLQIAIGVFTFLEIRNKDDLREKVDKTLTTMFGHYPNSEQAKELPDLIQSKLECCGVDGPNYWNGTIPTSCYKEGNTIAYSSGCNQVFYEFLSNTLTIIGIIVLALSALEVVGCIFSLCLSSSIKNRERRFRV